MALNFDIAILTALNSRDLNSVIYDIIHLSYIVKASKIYMLCDALNLLAKIHKSETIRLKKRNIIIPELPETILVKNYLSQLEQLLLANNGKKYILFFILTWIFWISI